MKIDIRNTPSYKSLKIEEGLTIIDFGLLNDLEQKELAEIFLSASINLIQSESSLKYIWENTSESIQQNFLEYIGIEIK